MRDIFIGRIAGVFGLRGELKCDPTGAGRSCFFTGAEVDVDIAGRRRTLRVRSVREHKKRLLVAFDGVPDATAAEAFPNASLYASRDQITVEEGHYLDEDLVGCEVFGIDGRSHGKIDRVDSYPAGPMLMVGARMMPLVDAFIKEIDPAAKRVVVDVPAGLLDDDAEEA